MPLLQNVLDEIQQALLAGNYDGAEKMVLQQKEAGQSIPVMLGFLTSIYIETGKQEKAESAVRELLTLCPRDAYALFLQARVHFMAGERESLIRPLEQTLKKGKNMQPAYQEKIYNLLGQCWRAAGNAQKSAACYLAASRAAVQPLLKAENYSNYLFNLHYLTDLSAKKKYAAHQGYHCIFAEYPHFLHRRRWMGKKLRIGYISSDLRNHVVLRFSYAFFSHYDSEKFEVFAYACSSEDEYSQQLKNMVTGWRNLSGLEPVAAARCIFDDQIDILVDLSGHTKNNCLPVLAYKPAPIQVSGIGYFDTTGLQTIDYLLGDSYLDSAGTLCSEKLLSLPHSHFCYRPWGDIPPAAAAAPCQKNGYVTLGSFNNFTKVNDAVLVVWRDIMQCLPEAHLLLKADIFNRQSGRRRIEQRLEKAGFDLSRIEMRGFSKNYLMEYQDMDIALDTWPYPGGGTTCDALYMGVPVVTMQGSDHGSRFGYSILMNLGLSELCAVDGKDYCRIVQQLASDFAVLNLLHQNLRSMLEKSPVMDSVHYMQDLESGYQSIWQDFCAHQPVPAYRNLSGMMIRLKEFMSRQDILQALAVADAILAAEPQDHHMLEDLLALYIDQADVGQARAAWQLLQKNGGDSGYDLFLQARVEYLSDDWQQALSCGQQALQKHDMQAWQTGMVHNLLAKIYKGTGQIEAAVEHYLAASRFTPDLAGKTADYSNYLFCLHYAARSRNFMYEAALQYNKLFEGIKCYEHRREERHEKLRIGYISPDLRFHVVAFFSYAFFKNYDPYRFEVYAYANCPEDHASYEFAAAVNHWRNISGMSAEKAAQRIHEDEIDILVDLSGHTENNCLPVLAYKPASIQISGIGYFNTTGLKTVDYFLADYYTDPVGDTGNDPFFSEKLLRLSHSHFCYTWHGNPQDCAPAPYQQNGYITFGSFNNFAKLSDTILTVWKEILAQVPGARLFLKTSVFDHKYGKQCALDRLSHVGIPLSRVDIAGHTADYLEDYGQVDIALDTWPYPGGGTTCDALYMGVPVVTFAGIRHNARFGYSLLMNVGLEECCAFSWDEYIAKAVQLAKNPQHLCMLHQTLRRRMRQSPLMDAGSYMAEVEMRYEQIWRQWCEGAAEKENSGQVVLSQRLRDMAMAMQCEAWPKVIRIGTSLADLPGITGRVFSSTAYAYVQVKDYGRAAFWLCRALLMDQENQVQLNYLLGGVLRELLDYVGAARAFQAAWEYGQNDLPAMQTKLLLARARSALVIGQTESAADAYRLAAEKADNLRDRCAAYSSYLLALHYRLVDPAVLYQAHLGYARLLSEVLPYPSGEERRDANQKIRLGYLSPDFRQHVMFSFYYVFFAAYDRQKFEVFGYQLNEETDGFTNALQKLADHWENLSGYAYEEIAKKIHADQIDILVDLAGHSAGSGLPVLAWKPAPVQISGLGYMATTGLSTVDYFITDVWLDPPSEPGCLVEKPLYLTSQFCYTGRNDVPESSGAPCRQTGSVLFGVFNHYMKITDAMLLAWKKILQHVPGSRLLLKSQVLVGDSAVDLAYERLQHLGFDMDRVMFEAATNTYMERYLAVDIALDTYPYPGGGTTCDALYMGVPVISLYGERRGSRFGYSVLQSLGLGEFAVSTIRQYIDMAIALAKDCELLDGLHRSLRQRMRTSVLMDTKKYMREWEEKLQQAVYRQDS